MSIASTASRRLRPASFGEGSIDAIGEGAAVDGGAPAGPSTHAVGSVVGANVGVDGGVPHAATATATVMRTTAEIRPQRGLGCIMSRPAIVLCQESVCIIERMLPAGSLNMAIGGPLPRMIARSSWPDSRRNARVRCLAGVSQSTAVELLRRPAIVGGEAGGAWPSANMEFLSGVPVRRGTSAGLIGPLEMAENRHER